MSRSHRNPKRSRSGKSGVVLGLTISLFLVLTAWNLTRTDSLAKAEAAFEIGDLQTSLRESLDILNRRPWSRDATLLAARSLSRLDYADAAEPYYRRVSDLSLDDLQIRAYGLVRANHRERAVQAYERILERYPADTLALRRLAGVQMTRSNDPEVLRLADRLIRIPAGAVYGYTLRGVIEHNQKNREDAVAAFEKVVELDPGFKLMPLPQRVFWGYFAYDLQDLGRSDEVVKYLGDVAEKAADSYLMNALARAYYLQADLDNAERSFRRSAEWDANDPISRLYLGKILIHRRKRLEALPFLEEAVKISTRHYDSLYTLAMTYRQLDRIDDANRLQPLIDELRDSPTPSPALAKTALPRHAL